MGKIKSARFMRSVEREGNTVAEVEFALEDGFGNPVYTAGKPPEEHGEGIGRYVAVLEKKGDQPYSLKRVFRNGADYKLDWYDNPRHRAYADVTEDVFNDGEALCGHSRESFVRDVLACEGVESDMESGEQ